MTYENDEVRHEFHQLPTDLQLEVTCLWMRLAKQSYFLHVHGVEDSEVVLRISQEPVTLGFGDVVSLDSN